MANIFKQQLDINQHPNRSNFDLTHKVHGSYKPGYIYPFLSKYVVPTDTFEIDTAVGMQCMPMPFPTQSNIRIEFYYFYQRLKNVWPNFENWLEMLEEHVPPYIDQPISFYKTGSLADFLDIPTTYVSSSDHVLEVTYGGYFDVENTPIRIEGQHFSTKPIENLAASGFTTRVITFYGASAIAPQPINQTQFIYYLLPLIDDYIEKNHVTPQLSFGICHIDSTGTATIVRPNLIQTNEYRPNQREQVHKVSSDFIETLNSFSGNSEYRLYMSIEGYQVAFNKDLYPDKIDKMYQQNLASNSVLDLTMLGQLDSPYYYSKAPYPTGGSPRNDVRVSALPFRVYESIFNAFFRNTVVQPFIVDGKKTYNRYNTTLEDGADATKYHLFVKNWELDAYTSCLPSPQQGNAPLVGMNALGQVSIEDENGTTTAQYSVADGVGKVVVTSPLASSDHGRVLMDLAQSGFSINDFRSVNALQRLLEQTLRSGYKYVDFIKGHFGSAPKHSVMDMPEFIGGFSQRLDVNMISNTNGVIPIESEQVLGSFAGQGRFFGSSKHKIKHYFDDYGIVMGVMCIVPDAAYSQILPKHFTYNQPLDFYFPEFSQLGMQPITYEELCPVQSHLEDKKLTDTFGYQRPNHEYVWFPDTLHGQFRTTLKDYVVNRIFATRPELGNEFVHINPSDVDHIFAVTEADNDTFVGQIVVGIHAKRPIPRIVIPGLGR